MIPNSLGSFSRAGLPPWPRLELSQFYGSQRTELSTRTSGRAHPGGYDMSIFTWLVRLFRGTESSTSARRESLRQQLRVITLHDEAKIDRLIAFERDELRREKAPRRHRRGSFREGLRAVGKGQPLAAIWKA